MADHIRLRFQILDPFEQNSTTHREVVDHAVPLPLKTFHLRGQIVYLTPLTGNDLLHLLLTHILATHNRTHC